MVSTLAPVHAGAGYGPTRALERVDVDPDVCESQFARGGRQEAAVDAGEVAVIHERARYRDAEAAGEVVVTGAALPKRLVAGCLREPATGQRGCEDAEALERVRDVFPRKAIPAVPSAPRGDDQAAVPELG